MVALLSKILKKNFKPTTSRQSKKQSKNAKQIDSSAMRATDLLEKQEGNSHFLRDSSTTSRTMTDSSYFATGADVEDGRSVLERLGGGRVLSVLVDDFYKRVTSDPELMLFFQSTNMNTLALHQKRFMSLAFTKIPSGMDLTRMILSHHDHLFTLGLDENHFDLVAQHLIAAMKEYGIDDDLIDDAIDIVAPLRAIFEAGAREP